MPAKVLQLRKPQNFRVVAYHFALPTGVVLFSLQATEDGLFDPDEASTKIVGMNLNPNTMRVYSEIESKQISDLARESGKLASLIRKTLLARCNASISDRQREVLNELLQGKANKEIAHELHITVRTVKFHVSALLEKFNMTTRYDLVSWYQTYREEPK